jgi:hypothetical protein
MATGVGERATRADMRFRRHAHSTTPVAAGADKTGIAVPWSGDEPL